MKKIFITQRVQVVEEYKERRDCLDQKWIELLNICGYLPILIPNNKKNILLMLEELKPDGIVLTGGNDLIRYGGSAPERDEVEKLLIKYGEENNIPILGVCRGMQMILDYYGVNLEKVDGHVAITHLISNHKSKKTVNSFHNYGAKEVNDKFEIIYKSADEVVEQIKHKHKEIYAIMWHPEREYNFKDDDIKYIKKIFR